MTIIARIDEHACAAHGDCLDFAPTAFALDDTAVVVGSAPYEQLLAAAQACPAVAITLIEGETGRQVFP
ncbi:MAG TPA: ferredoxin [Solirubrobacteraceae bacterium]|nr:ferredoxin [Solirubrobacteraceae bacterium]